MKSTAELVMEETNKLLNSQEFVLKHKVNKTDFLRKLELGFLNIMGICLNFTKRSLQVEIDDYFDGLNSLKTVTKQAFSKQRQRISHTAFQELFEMSVNTIISNNSIQTFKNHRFFAIDGTLLQLPIYGETAEFFGVNASSQRPEARVSVLCDVISNFLIHVEIDSNKVDERTLAERHLEAFLPYKQENDVVIFDRGYPSKHLVDYLHKNKIKYIIRLPKNYNKTIQKSSKTDFQTFMDGHRFRVIKLKLESGETEILITNLGKKAKNYFMMEDFKELYHLRWAVETKYDTLKNKMEIETFSGKNSISILQDFYAKMYLSNVATSIKLESDRIISDYFEEKKRSGKVFKHEYKTNENVLIGCLKRKLILYILNNDVCERISWLQQFILRASKRKVASPPDRHFERNFSFSGKVSEKVKSAI